MRPAAERFAVVGRTTCRCAIVAPEAVKIETVSKVSTLQKVALVARVAGQQVGRSRTFRAVMGAVRTMTRSFTRAAHQLWLEVMGLLFLLMALSFAIGTVREYGKYHAGGAGPGRVAIAFCFTLTFAWFGLSSFWRAHRRGQR